MNIKKVIATVILGVGLAFGATACSSDNVVGPGPVQSPAASSTTNSPKAEVPKSEPKTNEAPSCENGQIPASECTGTGGPAIDPAILDDPQYLDHVTTLTCKDNTKKAGAPSAWVKLSVRNKIPGDASYLILYGIFDSAGTQVGTFYSEPATGGKIPYGQQVIDEGGYALQYGEWPAEGGNCRVIQVERTEIK